MEILGLDISSLPWPVALLVLVLIGFSIFIFYVYLPLIDEVNRLKDYEEEELRKIKGVVLNFESFILSTLNEYNFNGTIETGLETLKDFNRNRFESISSLTNEVLRLNTDLNTYFERFDADFKDKVRIELKELKDFNKEYFNNILSILQDIERSKQELNSSIDKMQDDVKDIARDLENSSANSQRTLDSIKERLSGFSNQIDSMKEKINMLTALSSRYPQS